MKVSQVSLLTALALGALVAIIPASRAQDSNAPKPDRPAAGQRERRGGPGGGGGQLERISTELKLTDDQKAKLRPILQEENTKLRELRQDTALSREQRREKAREIREQSLGKIKPILTTEQFDQLKKMREHGPARGQRGARQGGAARPQGGDDKKQ